MTNEIEEVMKIARESGDWIGAHCTLKKMDLLHADIWDRARVDAREGNPIPSLDPSTKRSTRSTSPQDRKSVV